MSVALGSRCISEGRDRTNADCQILKMKGTKIILEGGFHSGDLRNLRVSSAQIKLLTSIWVGDGFKLWSCTMLD